MDNSNTTVVSFDPYPPPPTLSIFPNATTKRANVKLVQLGTVARPEVPALAAAPAAVASPPPSPPRSPPSPPAADPYQPSERRGWSGWCRVCKLLLPGFGACCCLLGCVCSAQLLLVYCCMQLFAVSPFPPSFPPTLQPSTQKATMACCAACQLLTCTFNLFLSLQASTHTTKMTWHMPSAYPTLWSASSRTSCPRAR